MKARPLIAFLLLILLTLGVIAYLGYEISRNERNRTSESYQALISQQLNDIDSSFQSQLLTLEQELIQSYQNPSSLSPLINHSFRLNPQNQLIEPAPLNLSTLDKSFLERTRSIWQSGLRFSAPYENTILPKPELNKNFPNNNPNNSYLGTQVSRSNILLKSNPSTLPTGWHAWFYDNDVHLLHWMQLPDGSTVGSEINRSAFLARLIGSLPSGDSLPDARISLHSATQQTLYQWGTYQPTPKEPPVLTLTLAAPLETWSLEYYSALIPQSQGGLTKPVLLNLAALSLTFLIVALWFLRENNRALREAARRVSFVNQVSHELKTPLTNIRLYTELASQSLADDEPAAKKLDVVTAETSRLSRLINNVLSFARSERKQLQLNPKTLASEPLLASILQHWEPTLSKAGITIESKLTDTLPVLADPDACEQILGNLLSNIEKYASTGQVAQLTTEQKKSHLLITVSDLGPGIPATARKRIFTPFSRLDSSLSEGTSGTGIGLSIARELARNMKGDLTLASQTSQGATFHWTLPLAETQKI